MKFTLSWLKDHLETTATLKEITETLTAIGLEVEEVIDQSKAFAPFKVAYVESAEKHPDADRLKVCKVNTGEEVIQVVCGAPNARAGMKAIFAPVGSYIPGLDVELKKGNIRGQDSCGMLVSEREMCLSEEHDGIIDLPDDAEIGTPMAQIFGLDDPVIDIAITPNRADCTGVRGIARDLVVAGLGTLKPLNTKDIKGAFKSPVDIKLKFEKDTQDACPHFLGRAIKGVKNGPSPAWMQKRLKAIGLRPISALVDITNYLSYDLCRPLHVFDIAKLKGDIHVRLSEKGEKLEALDEKTYTLDEGMTVVCDESGVIGLGGVMGGNSTGCTDSTTDVYIECAYFDPMRTARTGRALGINSDARYRFERGIDPAFTKDGMEVATALVLELCGGEASEVVTAGEPISWQRQIDYNPARPKELLGVDIESKEQQRILEALGFEAIDNNNKWSIQPPSWRGDVEGQADIVEEIGRINGYDSIPTTSLPRQNIRHDNSIETETFKKGRLARASLSALGYRECITWSFMNEKMAGLFGANENQHKDSLQLLNPISSEMSQMRPSILPNLIEAAHKNDARGQSSGRLFEVGPVFQSTKSDGFRVCASGIVYGDAQSKHWTEDTKERKTDMFDAKRDILTALEACGCPVGNLQVTRDAPDYYHPGRSAALRLGPNVIGYFGEVHPAILQEIDTDLKVSGFEFFMDAIPVSKKKGTARAPLNLSSFQSVKRDFAFIVDNDVDADSLVRAAKSVDKKLILDAEIFDVYSGKGVEDGKKSLALSVILQPEDATLTDSDIEGISKKIIEAISTKTNGKLRA